MKVNKFGIIGAVAGAIGGAAGGYFVGAKAADKFEAVKNIEASPNCVMDSEGDFDISDEVVTEETSEETK